MEVKIGVANAPREVTLESAQTPDEVSAAVAKAVAGGGLLSLTDEKGRVVVVPADKIAFVEIGTPERARLGFGA